KQLAQYAEDGSSYLETTRATMRLVDGADLLTEQEENRLLARLNEVSDRNDCDVVVVTAEDTDGKSAMDYADDYYDYHDYGQDGVLLLVSMEERDWWISTSGYGITALTDAGIEYIGDQIIGDLGDGNYADAFATYARLCDEFFTQAKTGDPYDVDNIESIPGYQKPAPNYLMWIGGSLLAGLIVALIGTGSMKSKLKTVRFQAAASSYLKPGSLNVTQARETFLYTHVDRVAKPQSSSSGGSSTHTSSSGSSHGGGGGHF
ncbi:MAG: TPM domain-containing protein, partial [Acutalibacteraceae bacterium]